MILRNSNFLLTILILTLVFASIKAQTNSEKFFDVDSYLRYNPVTSPSQHHLVGAENQLEFRFRYCYDRGILLYQEGDSSSSDLGYFLAIGVNSRRIYLEWKVTSETIIELYIGDGNLQPNTIYTVGLYNLNGPFQNTFAYINGLPATVDFLTPVTTGGLDMSKLLGNLFVGGYQDVNQLRVNTERLHGYLVACIDYIRSATTILDLNSADVTWGVKNQCPTDFCAPPTTITLQTTSSFVTMDTPHPPRTRTVISLRFRTRAQNGILFYFGGPAYLTVYMELGRLVLGLNTKGSGEGSFSQTSSANYNDGLWHYIRVTREGSVARLEDETGVQLARAVYTSNTGAAQTLNAAALMIGGVDTVATVTQPFPVNALTSLRGCIMELRFIVYSIAPEPPELLNFDTQVANERAVSHGGCFPSEVCQPACSVPSQVCNFVCQCAPGFYTFGTIPLVCMNIDDCSPNPCLNGATCIDGIQDYTCQCTLQFNKGKNCQFPNNCIPNQCQNGATCNDFVGGYNCSCADGYTGQFCEVEIDECESNPCQHNSICQDRVAGYVCVCTAGFTGADCEINIDECVSNPCLNGATCNDIVNAYFCTCASGWQGVHCSSNIDECLSGPCVNGATCMDLTNAYFCQCAPGWEGDRCELDIDECALGYCKNGAGCSHGINTYQCVCTAGWTGQNCDVNIDECVSQPCQNGAVCVDGVAGYTCQCPPGFTGLHCQIDIDECASYPCRNGGTCQDRINAFYCTCPLAWMGPQCNIEVNECASNPCLNNGACNDYIGYYTCTCRSGFQGIYCQIDVDECASFPCRNGGTCVDGANSYACVCPGGYVGGVCETEVDECASSPCTNQATCVDRVNGYTCECRPGYTGPNCDQDVDECQSEPCLNGATCFNLINAVVCSCRAGFSGTYCEVNIDECLVFNQCRNGATCVDAVNSYTCQCPPGWEGTFCERDVDECLSDPCQNGGTCADATNGFSCACPSNYQGPTCQLDVNECLTISPCNPDHTAYCENTYGSYRCVCRQGFEGFNCEIDVDECLSDPCYFGGTCIDHENGYTCQCQDGFIGPNCEAVIRSCPFNPCGLHAVCVEQPTGGFTCYCQPGYYGDQCEMDANECGSNPCFNGGICNDMINAYNCTCPKGYSGTRCEIDINECDSNPCQNGALCSQVVADAYQCICQPGYSGLNCEVDIDECATAPCQAHQICRDMVNGYMCECPQGMTGALCDIFIDDCHSNPCQNGATCVDGDFRYDCICVSGYTGINCEIDTDICDPNPCVHAGTCVRAVSPRNPELGFTCYCAPGFTGPRCEGDIYECRSNPCQHGGTCVEFTDGTMGYACICMSDYWGLNCQIYRYSCLSNPCQHGGQCLDTEEQGYVCTCASGWEGVNCELDINECQQIVPCQNGGQCVNYAGTYQCQCPDEWMGLQCELDYPECQSDPCLNGGVCLERVGQPFLCNCTQGFTGENCEINIDDCTSNPCQNGGTCQDLIDAYVCYCQPGYTGLVCESNIDECISNPCTNGATCLDEVNGFTCLCQPGFIGTFCEIDNDECAFSPCQNGATCIDQINGYLCLCPSGLQGPTCSEEVNECDSSPCQNNAVCVDSFNAYNCLCLPGWTDPTCSTNINDCSPNPCLYGVCNDFINYYTCTCNLGYTGYNCDQDIQECSSNPCRNNGICTEPQLGMYQCTCPQGTTGANCGVVNIATFSGDGYLTYPSIQDVVRMLGNQGNNRRKREVGVDEVLTITIQFTTPLTDAVILYASGTQPDGYPDYLAIEVYQGSLRFSFDVGGETEEAILGQSLNNQLQHAVKVTLIGSTAQVTLDNRNCGVGVCSASLSTTRLGFLSLNGPMYIGGVDMDSYSRSKLRSSGLYVGCLENFILNGNTISLDAETYSDPSAATRKKRQASPAPVPGCQIQYGCLSNPCRNGGECVEKWGYYECSCANGYSGMHCEIQTMATFSPGSFLHFTGTTSYSNVALRFSAQNDVPSDGVIMYMPSGVAVSLISGALKVQVIGPSGVQSVNIGSGLTNGDWYQLMLSVDSTDARILTTTIGSSAGDVLFSQVMFAIQDVVLSLPLFLGEVHSDPTLGAVRNAVDIQQSFTGCIRDISLAGQVLNLGTATLYTQLDPLFAVPGCPREVLCYQQPCRNDAECQGAWNDYSCTCSPDFTGVDCSEVKGSSYNGVDSNLNVILDTTLVSFGDHFSFDFRTRDGDAIVIRVDLFSASVTGVMSYFLFRITNSQPVLEVNFGQGSEYLNIPEFVTLGEWMTVAWTRQRDKVTLTFRGSQYELTGNYPMYQSERNDIVNVYLGAYPGGSASVDYLKGCVRDIQFNTQPIRYLDDATRSPGVTVLPTNMADGCDGDDVCASNPCPPNADCNDLWNYYVCTCKDGWQGEFCQDSVDECIGNQCLNNATCVDGHLDYVCACSSGFSGQFCQDIVNRCTEKPCQEDNTLSCTLLFPEDYVCRCKTGFAGKNCEIDVICFSQPCQNGGTCVRNDAGTAYTCSCPAFYEGYNCEAYNPCFIHQCQNDALCVANGTQYHCECTEGHWGMFCNDVDHCVSDPCLNSGVCVPLPDGYQCRCLPYYYGDACETPRDLCDENRCLNDGVCFHNTSRPETDFACLCPDGRDGELCEIDVDECLSQPCQNAGACVESGTTAGGSFYPGYQCRCLGGYAGINCEIDVDECASGPCQNGARCDDYVDYYTCVCLPYYAGANCELDMRTCDLNLCTNGATCSDDGVGRGFTCACPEGFGGEFCQNFINSCAERPCKNGGQCSYIHDCECVVYPDAILACAENAICERANCPVGCRLRYPPERTYECDCPINYTGPTCEEDFNECSMDPPVCENGGVCSNSPPGSYTCTCDTTGYTGRNCTENVDECSLGNNPCVAGTCVDTTGGFLCICNSGYTGERCDSNIDECIDNPCLNGGRCVDVFGSYECDCADTGYRGARCEDDLDECTDSDVPNPCVYGSCENTVGNYTCVCPVGAAGRHCEIRLDQCQDNNPCLNNGTCESQLVLGPRCNCSGTGYGGEFCGDNVNECTAQTHQCHNGGECEDIPGSYLCRCSFSYRGDFCEIAAQTSTSPVVYIIPILIILIILLILLLYAWWYVRKTRKMKGKYNPAKVELETGTPLSNMLDADTGERLI